MKNAIIATAIALICLTGPASATRRPTIHQRITALEERVDKLEKGAKYLRAAITNQTKRIDAIIGTLAKTGVRVDGEMTPFEKATLNQARQQAQNEAQRRAFERAQPPPRDFSAEDNIRRRHDQQQRSLRAIQRELRDLNSKVDDSNLQNFPY